MQDEPQEQRRLALAIAGFLATAVTYGPARMGFGLFLPQFRDVFELSTQSAGLIASLGFFGFFLAIPLSGLLTAKRGPRRAIVLGGCLATAGLAIVALAESAALLTAGVVLAGASAGLSWSPYNNAAERLIDPNWRPRSLSIISTGTTVGVALAGVLALATAHYGFSWRMAWVIFAILGLAMTLFNLWALRSVAGSPGAGVDDEIRRPSTALRRLFRPEAFPLFAGAFSFSLTISVFFSFGVDHIVASGGLPGVSAEAAPAAIFIAFGVAGLIGLYTSDLADKIGLAWLLRGVFVCSAAALLLVGVAPTSWLAMLLSAGLMGACLMVISAAKAFWSERLFPNLPAVSFTAVIMTSALGAVISPAGAAALSHSVGLEGAFVIAAGVSLMTALIFRRPLLGAPTPSGERGAA